ncbi:MAG: cation-transporting P-type ATPase, partial [Saprospiraceae bacterium]|nr:cation-transporting P-type ATPase [Saprospiraceae bacterium]
MDIKIPEKIHAQEAKEVLKELDTDLSRGLTEAEVQKRREKFGANRLAKEERKNIGLIFLEQFLDPVIYVLAAATILAFTFEHYIEGVAVAIVILITALIGFFMEWQAIRSMEQLRKMAETVCRVLRGGEEKEIKATELVPGDIVLLKMGDVVPADARLIEHENLAVKESALTGESTQVDKQADPIQEDAPLAERSDMVFKGTLVSRGTARVVVTATGDETELGKITRMTREAEQEKTPLEKRLNTLSHRLIQLTLVLAVIIAAAGYVQGRPLLLMIETAVALAVAAIPEGLPIVATIALARGMLRLARRRVIIKKLEAVQTLGEASVICTDKTGTLTENRMEVQDLVLEAEHIDLKQGSPEKHKNEEALNWLLKVSVLCNDAEPGSDDEEPKGDPLEVALLQVAQKMGKEAQEMRADFPEETELPFDTEKKMMGTLNRTEEGFVICVKGAVEPLLERCVKSLHPDGAGDFSDEDRKEWENKADELASDGLRTLGFAYREASEKPEEEDFMHDLTFLGIAGFIDPPRSDVKDAIATCHNAGIQVVMVTGDHPKTALEIARQIGLVDKGETAKVVHGKDLEPPGSLSEEEQESLLATNVFARVTPAQKLDLIDLYQKHDRIVGMTGDGVNDAPALKKADIGIAMGIRGTEAAKEVADAILRDDRFTTIELAIKQGRIIFENIRKFVIYLLSSNLAEIISVAGASLSNLPLPLLPLQILYLNLVTDVFPALALGLGEGERKIMDRPPRDPKEPIMPRRKWISTIVYGLGITAGVLGITLYGNLYMKASKEIVNNMAFYTLVGAQLLNVLNLPGRDVSFFRNEVTTNLWVWGAILLCILLTAMGYFIPLLREVLSLVPIEGEHL